MPTLATPRFNNCTEAAGYWPEKLRRRWRQLYTPPRLGSGHEDSGTERQMLRPQGRIGVRITLQEVELQRQVKRVSAKWNSTRRLWEMRYDQALALGLKDRIGELKVTDTRKRRITMVSESSQESGKGGAAVSTLLKELWKNDESSDSGR